MPGKVTTGKKKKKPEEKALVISYHMQLLACEVSQGQCCTTTQAPHE